MVRLQEQLIKRISSAKSLLAQIKQEEAKLSVRRFAVRRCQQAVSASQTEQADDAEENEYSEILENIEAIDCDLTTYIDQLRDKRTHIENGITVLDTLKSTRLSCELANYIEEDARLCVRDVGVARAGYDDLISRLRDITHTRDQ